MIKLFIENNEIEITDDIQVAITKQFEELSNPTTIINDWSKTVSIPFTVKNNKIFGNIYNADRLITHKVSTNYISGSPSSIKMWNGSTYVNDSLVNGEIVCPLDVEYLQVGFQNQNWSYSKTINYNCNNDTHTYEFIYDSTDDYRFEFSFRNLASDAQNNEVYFVQWELGNKGLVNGKTYVVSFKHRKSGNNYVIYNYSISDKESLVGVNFNPLKKLDFRIEWNNDILMTGYAKMNDVKQSNGNGVYNITLFGQLGKLFQEMQKITFDKTVNDTSYLIDGAKYVDDYINRTLVYNSWNSTGQTHSELIEKGETGYNVTDIIGFAPNNSYSEDFDYKTFQSSSNSSTSWEDYLGDSFTQDTGIQPSTVMPNGLLPREVGEYRSYLQLPFIYWNKLFKIYQAKAEKITGYQFDLDNEWFNTANPYWYNLVYMLKPLNFSNKDATALVNRYKTTDDIYTWTPTVHHGGGGHQHYTYVTWDGTETTNVSSFAEKTETTPIYVSGNTFQIDESTQLTSDGSFNVRFSTTADSSGLDIKFNVDYQVFVINLTYTGVNTGNVVNKKIVLAGSNPTDTNAINIVNSADSVGVLSNPQANSYYDSNLGKYVYYVDFIAPLPKLTVNATGLDTVFTIKYTATWGGSTSRGKTPPPFVNGTTAYTIAVNSDIVLSLNMSAKQGTFYSGSRFNLNDLWNKEFKLFDEIIKYCKIYRINITVDEFGKKIKFRRLPRYFRDYEVVDWTDKIDMSKDYIIKPITFENKYVLFNYKDSKTALGEEYKKRYGVNYGDYRLITDYNFNDSKTELFKDISQSIVSSDNVLSWLTLARHRVAYTLGAEIFVNNRDKDKKQVDIFGAYFFHNGVANFDVGNGSELVGVNISDDSALQRGNSTFFYSYIQTDRVYTTSYPKLDIVMDDYMCVFNKPKENFTYLANYANKKTIYDNFWYDYINERYNIQNKLITCYVYLKPTDYINFDFNNLIRVGNQLCLVNKIYDYDVSSTVPTKVDLVTIQNIGGYTNDDFISGIDMLGLSWSSTYYLNGNTGSTQQLGTFTSITDVTFANGGKTYTSNGVKFTISGNSVYYQCTSRYVDKEDKNMTIVLKNNHNTASFNIVRYSVYPYPELKLYNDDGTTERSTIYPGTRNYKLGWYGTETYGLENKPTVTIEIHGTGSAVIDANTWVENQVMIQEGDDEWFRTEYMVNFNTNMTNYSGSYVRVTMVDKEGWHETRDFPVSL